MKKQMLRVLVEILTVAILISVGLVVLTHASDAQIRKQHRDTLVNCKETHPGGLEYKLSKEGCFVRVSKTMWVHEEKFN